MAMKTIFQLFLLSLSLLLCWSCQQEPIAVIEQTDNIEVYVSGEAMDQDTNAFEAFQYEIGTLFENSPFDDVDPPYIQWFSLPLEDESGPSILTGAMYDTYGNGDPIFALQFWLEGLSSDRQPTETEVLDTFEPGAALPFGKGTGKVDVWLLMPLSGPPSFPLVASRAYYLENPQGELQILSVEDYPWEPGNDNQSVRTGKLIHCTFEGEIGRYDHDKHLSLGLTNFDIVPFTTDVAVPVRGEARFFMEYK